MTDPQDPDVQSSGPTKRSRLEIRSIIALVLAVVIGGGVYVAVFGSPARHRAVIDSPNTNPYVVQSPAPHR